MAPTATTVKVLESLRKRLADLREHARFQVVVSGVVGAAPPDETFEVIATAKAMGFRPRVLVVHGPDGQIRLSAEERKGYTRLQKMIGRHLFEFSRYRHQLVTTGEAPFKCRAGSRYLYVDEYGTVGWCSQTRQFFGKPLAEYTYGDLRRQFHTPKACHRQCTLGCVRSSSVFDAWRPQKKSPHRLETDAGISVQSKIA
ncbi:MAG: hypothetical protein HYV02_06510 [Deltaproteobacteria bacterium]|nr:hypothetical protein [Deltaproteobacteria bacterium]